MGIRGRLTCTLTARYTSTGNVLVSKSNIEGSNVPVHLRLHFNKSLLAYVRHDGYFIRLTLQIEKKRLSLRYKELE